MTLQTRRAVASLAVLALLTACQPSVPSAAPTSSGAAARDVLNVAVTGDPAAGGFNRPSNIAGRRLSLALFNGLFEKNYDDATKPATEVIPGLATSWDVSPDGLTYTFHLRNGVQFTDGTAVDANAVVFNFRMLLDQSFEYFDAKNAPGVVSSVTGSHVQSYRALDSGTFQMVLKQPFGGLLDDWSQPGLNPMWLVSPAAVKQFGVDGINQHPVGTGPFKLDSYKAGESVVLSRNDTYFRGPSAIKTMAWQIITDPTARAAALESGQVQVAESIAVQYKEQWKSRTDIVVQSTTAPNSHACWLNSKSGPMTNMEIRHAASLALNRPQINQLAMGGLAPIPTGYLSPGTIAFVAGRPAIVSDPKAAATLVDQLKAKGTTLTYETTSSLGEPAVWDVLNRNLGEAGFTPIQRSVDLATWTGDLARGLQAAGLDMLCGLMGSDTMLQLNTLLAPQGWLPDPKLDAAMDAVKSAPTFDAYISALRGADELLVSDYVALFVITTPKINGISAALNWQSTPTHAHSFYTAKFK
jgi:peptide/nickel transport system substrate-binding protein